VKGGVKGGEGGRGEGRRGRGRERINSLSFITHRFVLMTFDLRPHTQLSHYITHYLDNVGNGGRSFRIWTTDGLVFNSHCCTDSVLTNQINNDLIFAHILLCCLHDPIRNCRREEEHLWFRLLACVKVCASVGVWVVSM